MVASTLFTESTRQGVENVQYDVLSQFTPSVGLEESPAETLDGFSFQADSSEEEGGQEAPALTENLTARYFGEVRQFSLLKPAAERAAWARIEQYKTRRHRALATSPVALTTLQQYVERANDGTYALSQLVEETATEPLAPAERLQHVSISLQTLQTLQAEITSRHTTKPAAHTPPQSRRIWRQEQARLWRQWLATWHALQLAPSMEDILWDALQTALQTQPHQRALRAAQAAYRRAQRQLTAAQEDMLKANLRLVIHVAKRYHNRDMPLLDLIQEGNIGLMRAIEKFEPRRGVRFVTYAHWWIRQAVSRALQEQQRTVRIPSHVAERQTKLRQAWERLSSEQQRPPALQELSTALGWTPQEVVHLQTVGQPIVRLQTPLTTDKRHEKTLLDVMEDTQNQTLEDYCMEEQLHHRLAACLDSLTTREAFILRLRYGLEADHAHSLQEIADILGLSRERVRQVEHQALKKLSQSRYRHLLAELAQA